MCRIVFACAGSVVRGFSSQTGEELFDCVGHKGATTSVQLHPKNPQRLVSSSLDGTVCVWDATDGALLHTFELGVPITHAVFPEGTPGVGFAAVLRRAGPKGSERYIPGQEVARLEHARGKSAHPEIEIVQLAIPGLEDAVASLEDNEASISASIVAPQRGFCTGFDVREPAESSSAAPASFVVGAPGGVRLQSSEHENGGVLVVFGVHRNLYVWNTAAEAVSMVRHARPLTCLSVHPFADYVVAGDVEGQLVAFHCLGHSSDKDSWGGEAAARTTRHWHAHAAACCDFTPDGSLLLSGGEEAVLVMWQLGGREDRNFLPRLGAPLRSVTSSFPAPGKSEAAESLPPVYIVGLGDCSLLMVEAGSLREMWRVRGLAVAGAVEAPVRHRMTSNPDKLVPEGDTGEGALGLENGIEATPGPRGPGQFLAQKLLVDPRAGHVIVNGFPGKCSLQFYDVYRRRHVRELEVAPRNVVSRVDDAPPPVLGVTQAVLSTDGESLATVERNSDNAIGSHPVLKFWTFSAASQRFLQTTRVDDPHKGSDVVVMDYHPSSHLVFTAASHRSFKVWQRQTVRPVEATLAQKDRRRSGKKGRAEDAPRLEYVWSCRSAGFFRDLPITTGCFSGDGSLLAVVFGHVITVWSPLSNTLCGTLTHTTRAQPYRHVAFLGQSAYLVAATESELQVWNLLSQTVEWSYTTASTGSDSARLVHLCVDRAVKRTDSPDEKPWFAVVLQMEATVDDTNASSSSAAVLLWNAADPVPLKVWRMTPEDSVVQAAQGGLWVAAAILGRQDASSELPDVAALSSDNKLWLLSDKSETVAGDRQHPAPLRSTTQPRPVRSRLAQLTFALAAQGQGDAERHVNGRPAASGVTWKSARAADLISGATHTLPPVSAFCSDLLASLAPRRRESVSSGARGSADRMPRRLTSDGELPPADTLADALVASARSHGEEDEWTHWGVQFVTYEPEPVGEEGDRSMKQIRPFCRTLFAGQTERKRNREEHETDVPVSVHSPPKAKRQRKTRRAANGVASK